jgi:hypothetical protein
MRPLTLDDLLPLEEYAGRRREFFEAHRRYLDRYRRARLGPRLTLLFENRQTLWFRLQEVLRVSRLAEPRRVQEELDLYNRLLPAHGCLQAAVLIGLEDDSRLVEELAFWQNLQGQDLGLRIGETLFPAALVTSRPEDRVIGAAHWVQFALGEHGVALLADFGRAVHLVIEYADYRYASPPLGEDVRQSLLDDLNPSPVSG